MNLGELVEAGGRGIVDAELAGGSVGEVGEGERGLRGGGSGELVPRLLGVVGGTV